MLSGYLLSNLSYLRSMNFSVVRFGTVSQPWQKQTPLNGLSCASIFLRLLLIGPFIYRKSFNFLRMSASKRFNNLRAKKSGAPLFMEIFLLCQRRCLLMLRILRRYE